MVKGICSLGTGEEIKSVEEEKENSFLNSMGFFGLKTHPWLRSSAHRTVVLAVSVCLQTHMKEPSCPTSSYRWICFAAIISVVRCNLLLLLWPAAEFICVFDLQAVETYKND